MKRDIIESKVISYDEENIWLRQPTEQDWTRMGGVEELRSIERRVNRRLLTGTATAPRVQHRRDAVETKRTVEAIVANFRSRKGSKFRSSGAPESCPP